MKLIFIYGAPATGKLTVAKELSKITGYKLFHNHLTADLVHAIFPFGVKEYTDITEKLRLDLFEAAAKNKIEGIIFTFVYGVEAGGRRADDAFVQKAISVVEKHKGKVLFVKLFCDQKELYKRLKQSSRRAYGKMRKIQTFTAVSKSYKLNETIPFGQSLKIDNTKLSPQKAARLIRKHYKL